MSYCRMSPGSDIYLISTGRDLECFCGNDGRVTKSRTEMMQHLFQHRESGDRVPDYAIARLAREIVEQGDTIGERDSNA